MNKKSVLSKRKNFMIKYRQFITDVIRELKAYKFLIKPILIFCLLYLISFFGIILAHVNYMDDLGRSMAGYTEWNYFGRYVSTGLSFILHTNHYLSDISPLAQFVAIIFLSTASALAVYIITGKKKFSISHYIAGILIGVSPYFLECFSYKFDSPYMALSILVSILPLVSYRRNNKNTPFYITTFICAIVVCSTYQAGSGIYFVLVILLTFKELAINNENIKNILLIFIKQCAPFLLGVFCYKIFMMPVTNDAGYVSNQLPGLIEFIPNAIHNLITFYTNIHLDFCGLWEVLIVIILALFVIAPAIKVKKPIILLYSLVALTAISIVAFGFYVVIAKPLFAARAMYGYCVALGLVSIFVVDLLNGSFILKLPIYGIAWCFLVFSFIYSNSLIAQARWDDFRINETITALSNERILTDNTESISVNGAIGYAPEIRNTVERYPVLKKLVIPYYGGGDWSWETYKICRYYGFSLDSAKCIANSDNTIDSPQELNTYYDNILYNDKKIIINLK